MSGKRLRFGGRATWLALLISLSWLTSLGATNSEPNTVSSLAAAGLDPVGSDVNSDLLQFLDGASLHGNLEFIDPDRGIGWRNPNARELIEFKPDQVAWVRFEKPTPVSPLAKPTSRFRFTNGDEVFGELASIDEQNVRLRTWFSGELTTPRESVQSITFLSKGYSVLYEGPTSADGWVQGRAGRGWEYRDGAFIATRMGTLGRDLKLSGSCSVAFDLAWNGQFSLILALYTSVLDRFDYGSSSYMFYLSPGYVSLQRVQGGSGAINLGQAAISDMGRKNRLRIEIRANKDDSTLGLLVDDRLVQRWKDSAGFLGQGSGIVFFAQLEGPSVRVSNLKVAQWEGDSGLEGATNAPSKDDLVYLINRDRVGGQLRSVQNGTLAISAEPTSLEIPLARVTQISFGNSVTNTPGSGPWELRAYFAGGGTVAFGLNGWQDGHVAGQSGNFGAVRFDSRYMRQLQFNLQRSRLASADVEILDQEIWDLE